MELEDRVQELSDDLARLVERMRGLDASDAHPLVRTELANALRDASDAAHHAGEAADLLRRTRAVLDRLWDDAVKEMQEEKRIRDTWVRAELFYSLFGQ